ncbi:hypothetical protein KAR91_15855 [Candidatus Pacearchaeota archaeon]|nr:hypothetical protein [Candidatus Pacearchaeota archaeon]
MLDKGYVIITVRKEVPDRDQARIIYDLVKARLADRPDVKLTGHLSNHFDLEE